MRILILSQNITKSGVGRYIQQITERFIRDGDEVHVLAYKCGLELSAQANLQLFRYAESKNPVKIWKNYQQFKKNVEKNAIDVVYIQHRVAGIYVSLYNLFHRNIPTVYVLHTAKLEQNNFIKKLVTNTGDFSIAISSEVEDCLIRSLGVKKEKIRKIYNGVDDTLLSPLSQEEKQSVKEKWNIPKDKTIICMHGRIDDVKGHDVLVRALKKMSAEDLNKIHVVVSGEMRTEYSFALREQITRENLDNYFTFVGWANTREVVGISNLMVAPSRREGFPLNVLEAFFMKVPVIRSRTGGFTDMKDYCTGIDIDDEDGLLKYTCDYLKNPKPFEETAQKAYEWAQEHGTIEKMTGYVKDVFKEAIYANQKS